MNIAALKDSASAQDLNEDRIGKEIVDAAFRVHKNLGPGLLETVYDLCLAEELSAKGFSLVSQKSIPIIYNDKKLDAGFRLDLVIEDSVVVEVKAVEQLLPVHQAQLLTYLNLSGCRLGYLINFNVPLIKDGIKRMVRRK